MKVDQVLLEHLDQVLKVPGVQAKGDGDSEFAALLGQALAGNMKAEAEIEEIVGSMAEGSGDLSFLLDHFIDGEIPLQDGDELAGEMLSAEAKAALLQLQQLLGQHQALIPDAVPEDTAAKAVPAAKGDAGNQVFNIDLNSASVPAEPNLNAVAQADKVAFAEKVVPEVKIALSKEQGENADARTKPADFRPELTPEQLAAKEVAAKKTVETEAADKVNLKENLQQRSANVNQADDLKNAAQQKPVFEKPPVQAEGGAKDFASAMRNSEPAAAKPQSSSPAVEQAAIFQQPTVQGDDALQASKILQTPVQANNLRESIIQQLEGRMVYLRETAANPAEMRMTLHPPELGEVTIRVFSKQGRLSASIIAETPLVKEILENSITELRQRMNFVSIDFEQLDFSAKEDQFNGSGRPNDGKSNPILDQDSKGRTGPLSDRGEPALQNAPPGSDVRGIDYWA